MKKQPERSWTECRGGALGLTVPALRVGLTAIPKGVIHGKIDIKQYV